MQSNSMHSFPSHWRLKHATCLQLSGNAAHITHGKGRSVRRHCLAQDGPERIINPELTSLSMPAQPSSSAPSEEKPQGKQKQAVVSKGVVTHIPAAPERLLGVDFGTTRTGLAVGQRGVCTPLQVLACSPAESKSALGQKVIDIAVAQGVEAILIGIPVQRPGNILDSDSDSKVGRKCRHFAHTLALIGGNRQMPVYLYDETKTSQAAMMTMGILGTARQKGLSWGSKQDTDIDAVSAAMLLHLYFGSPGQAVLIRMSNTAPTSASATGEGQNQGGSSQASPPPLAAASAQQHTQQALPQRFTTAPSRVSTSTAKPQAVVSNRLLQPPLRPIAVK